ncbi:LPS assembly lipoprotein LptE [Comamonas sp. JC664]|uniref:LPS assembly lipoprotein LptE n=1 Tax=Comamonas sp. JC664 TaxID=2801917 RepID=UPI00174E76BB|nr:LPS assembly lipoprotein LptE [Comamonas sp. JC664]MBL0697270.1 hypothetical protein [Comamonas sp. JC664]
MSRPFAAVPRRLRTGVVLGMWVAAGAGCGYRLTPRGDGLPEGVTALCAPVFTNATAEPTLETVFTRFLRQELIRVGRLSDTASCNARMEGTVLSVASSPTIIPNYFRVFAQARVRIVKDGQVLTETVVSGTEDYLLGSGDVLEAEANRQVALERLAEVLMRDGYDKLAGAW